MADLAQCLSRSCTTGWLDWVHGELWLSPVGLIRRRLSWSESKSHGLGPTVGTPLPESALGSFDLATLLAEHPTNKVIYFDAVVTARLVKGRTSDALRLAMSDGDRHKLLWLRRDPAYEILSNSLPAALGDRLLR
ncbi:hypothetical protein KBX37_27340 [Micromonospora sp. U56]|uniref:hypothetical protein n=1 Tax=Micromonospora sp. U56 TaxID=2824900 RepID=UPI001B37F68C|nr:hypothetical protein [Micromonospora sp. U56]MBQ0896762.1 hypothetical protein [Micromonospora sp. U56]